MPSMGAHDPQEAAQSVRRLQNLGDERLVRLVFHASALIGGRSPEEAEAAYQRFTSG